MLTTWLAVVCAAALPLTPVEREYFAAPLADAVAAVRSSLRDDGCALIANPYDKTAPVPKENEPAGWLKPDSQIVDRSLAPAENEWRVFLQCKGFKVAVALGASAFPMPETKVLSKGDGFAIRSLTEPAELLAVGELLYFQPGGSLPAHQVPESGPSLALPIVVMVGAEPEPNNPPVLERLKKLDVSALKAVLTAATKRVPPKTAFVFESPRGQDPRAARIDRLLEEPSYVAARKPAARRPLPAEKQLPNIERVNDDNERAYFQTLRARTLKAVLQAAKQGHLDCEPLAAEEDALERSMPTRFGFAPRGLTHLAFSCKSESGARKSLSVGLAGSEWRLEGTRRTVAPGVTRIVAVESVRGFRPETMGIGAFEPAATIAEGPMVLSGLTLTVLQETERSLLDQLDPAPLIALLAKPPLPPAARTPVREGPPMDSSRRAAVEAEVYRGLLKDFARGRSPAVIGETTLARAPDWRKRIGELGLVVDLLPSTLEDFDEVAGTPGTFPPELDWGMPVKLLSARESEAIFGSGGWKNYWETFKGGTSYLGFSRVGLSRDGTQAAVQMSWASAELAASGDIWILRKTESGWRVTYVIPLWVS